MLDAQISSRILISMLKKRCSLSSRDEKGNNSHQEFPGRVRCALFSFRDLEMVSITLKPMPQKEFSWSL